MVFCLDIWVVAIPLEAKSNNRLSRGQRVYSASLRLRFHFKLHVILNSGLAWKCVHAYLFYFFSAAITIDLLDRPSVPE